MTGPAYVATVDLEGLPSQTGLGPLFVPTCTTHETTWSGPSARDETTAQANARVHNTDVHGDDQEGLW